VNGRGEKQCISVVKSRRLPVTPATCQTVILRPKRSSQVCRHRAMSVLRLAMSRIYIYVCVFYTTCLSVTDGQQLTKKLITNSLINLI